MNHDPDSKAYVSATRPSNGADRRAMVLLKTDRSYKVWGFRATAMKKSSLSILETNIQHCSP